MFQVKTDDRFTLIQMGLFKKIIYKRKPLERVSVHLCEHCNLNCHNCDNFSPVACEEFPDTQLLKRDIERLSEILNRELPQLIFTGGEPLLNDHVDEIVACARECFPDTKISIVTNGILILRQSESFWRALRSNKIILSVTKYPIKLDYNKIEEKCQGEEVGLEYFNDANVTKTSFHMPFDLNGKQKLNRNIPECYHFNNCVQMYHGKIFNCSIAANVKHFNKFFEQKLPEDGFIDIYKVKNRKKLERKLSRPLPLCNYCKIMERTYDNEWGISKRDIREWT